MLTGTYEVKLDRGRLTIPSRLRDQMEGRAWDRVAIFPWKERVCLVAAGDDPLKAALAAVLPDASTADRECVRTVASKIVIEVMDHRGRICIPGFALKTLDGDDLVVVGAVGHVEVVAQSR